MRRKFIYVKKYYKIFLISLVLVGVSFGFVYTKKRIKNTDFGKTFEKKAADAIKQLQQMEAAFSTCADICRVTPGFLKAIIFPELMRYNSIKDGVEAESLRTLYVQFGEEYANFSIGLFQMKPGFAQQVEEKAKILLTDSIYRELELNYGVADAETIRAKRVERLMDKEWQLVYLTAFTLICAEIYKTHEFKNEVEKLQWFATVYNAGFNQSDTYIQKKINAENFYLNNHMPGKKFKYAAIASWFFQQEK